jgi:hypothetical protein
MKSRKSWVAAWASCTGHSTGTETTWALVAKHLEEQPPDPRKLNPDVSGALAAVILKAMAKEPKDRFATASDMHDALARIG